MANNTILRGVWCFNKNITFNANTNFTVNFKCDFSDIKQFDCIKANEAGNWLLYGASETVYLAHRINVWESENCKTIVILDDVEQTPGLLNWLQENANKVNIGISVENPTVPGYLYDISLLQAAMNELIISEGGTVPYKSLEQYMNSLIDLRKKFTELLNTYGVEASEGDKMGTSWADKFNSAALSLIRGFTLENVEIVDSETTEISAFHLSNKDSYGIYARGRGYGVPRIKKLTLTNVNTIGESAFAGADIEELYLPNYKKYHCYDDSTYNYPVFDSSFKVDKIYMPSKTSVFANEFSGCRAVEIYLDSATRIYARAFQNCTRLTKIHIPKLQAFYTSVSFPTPSVFKACTNLTEIDLGELSVFIKAYGDDAIHDSSEIFQDCTNLKIVRASIASKIEDYARPFYNCTNLTTFYAPKMTYIGAAAFYMGNSDASLENLTLGNVTYIGEYAFYRCIKLNITDWEYLTDIGQYAFYKCNALTSFTAPNLSSVKLYSLASCSSLKTVDLASCTELAASAFSGCSSLRNINIPLVTTINISSFNSCTDLKKISMPQLQILPNQSMLYCNKLTEIALASAYCIETNVFANYAAQAKHFYLGYKGVVTLQGSGSVHSGSVIHVRPEYVDQYTTATNWSSLIAGGGITILGDYTDYYPDEEVSE